MHLDLICFDDIVIAKFTNSGLSRLKHKRAFEQTLLLKGQRLTFSFVHREEFDEKLSHKVDSKMKKGMIEVVSFADRAFGAFTTKGLSSLRKGNIVERKFMIGEHHMRLVFMNHTAYITRFHTKVKDALKKKLQEKYDEKDAIEGKKSGIVE